MPKGGRTNPSPATRFGGPRGNKPGMTGLHSELVIKNAELAVKIRNDMLTAVADLIKANGKKSAIALVTADYLRLLKDAEERGLGAPKTPLELSNPDGSLAGEALKSAVIEYLKRLHAGDKP